MEDTGKEFDSLPRYHQIAIEIATRILSREYQVGQKIFARSSLASQHGVSSETARRAICLLADLNIVRAERGSGVIIESYENAQTFIAQFKKRRSIDTIKSELANSFLRQKNEMNYLNKCLADLMTATEHLRSNNPFVPFQLKITQDCLHLHTHVGDIKFWQQTGATIIAVIREDQTLVSPGPYLEFLENDVIFFLTADFSPERVEEFLYKKDI